jgi:hypothetical protein
MPGLKWLLAGGGLYWLARLFERFGDSLPYAAEGISWERLLFHSVALLILFGALFCFLRAGRVIWRVLRGDKPAPDKETKRLTAPARGPDAPAAFDPDAALTRYLETKATQGSTPPSRPSPGGFGRKGA